MMSMTDYQELVPENLEATIELTAADIMPQGVPPVAPETSVAEVLRLMVDHDVAGLAVVENDQIVGIITESDVVQRQADVDAPTPVPFLDAIFVADAGRPYEEEVRRALAVNARMMMSSPVTSIRHNATLEEIATVMIDLDLHPLPVVDDQDRYMGVVSRRDLVRVIAALENRVS
jgi:CBS domain-containing protein